MIDESNPSDKDGDSTSISDKSASSTKGNFWFGNDDNVITKCEYNNNVMSIKVSLLIMLIFIISIFSKSE